MKRTFRYIVLIFAVGMMFFSGHKLWVIYTEYAEGERVYDDYANRFVTDTVGVEAAKAEIIDIDFAALLAENKDIVGWIYCEGTPINYPVVQANDNNYYLRRLLDGTYNIAGTIFMDYRNSADLTDLNTIIYGHNMRNGTMFGSLANYLQQDYYEEHPVIYYLTPRQSYEIQLAAGFVTEAWSNIYSIPQTRAEQNELLQEIASKSRFKAKICLEEGDKIVTLSTCAHDFDGARYVVIGKVIKPQP